MCFAPQAGDRDAKGETIIVAAHARQIYIGNEGRLLRLRPLGREETAAVLLATGLACTLLGQKGTTRPLPCMARPYLFSSLAKTGECFFLRASKANNTADERSGRYRGLYPDRVICRGGPGRGRVVVVGLACFYAWRGREAAVLCVRPGFDLIGRSADPPAADENLKIKRFHVFLEKVNWSACMSAPKSSRNKYEMYFCTEYSSKYYIICIPVCMYEYDTRK